MAEQRSALNLRCLAAAAGVGVGGDGEGEWSLVAARQVPALTGRERVRLVSVSRWPPPRMYPGHAKAPFPLDRVG